MFPSFIKYQWTIGFYPCCGLFKLEKVGKFVIIAVQDIIQPLQTDKLLESETSFCDICHKNCTSPADFCFLHQENMFHLCVPFICFVPICPFLLILLILVLRYAHHGIFMVVWKTAIFFNLGFRNCFWSCYFCNFYDVVPLFYIVIKLTIFSKAFSSTYLVIVQGK